MQSNKDYLNCLIVGIVIALIGYIFDFTYGNAILLGLIFSLVHYKIAAIMFTRLLANQHYNGFQFAIMYLGNLMLLAIPLLICGLYSNIFNMIACGLGLVIHNGYLYVNEFIRRKRGD